MIGAAAGFGMYIAALEAPKDSAFDDLWARSEANWRDQQEKEGGNSKHTHTL